MPAICSKFTTERDQLLFILTETRFAINRIMIAERNGNRTGLNPESGVCIPIPSLINCLKINILSLLKYRLS